MARQGRLRQRTTPFRCTLLASISRCALLVLIWAGLLAPGPAAIAQVGSSPVDLRVTFEFQAPAPQSWHLRLRITDDGNREARLSELRNFSQADSTSGMFDLSADGQTLTLKPRHEIPGGKWEMRIRGSRGARLLVERMPNGSQPTEEPTVHTIAITDLIKDTTIRHPGADEDKAAEWTITRVPSDRLRISDLAAVPVYQPGAPLHASLQANAMLDQASQSCVLSYELYRVSDGAIVQDHRWPIHIDAEGNSQPVALAEQAPEEAGVYELRVQIEADDENIWSRLRRRPPPLVRVTRPIAVLHRQNPAASDSGSWREVGVIRPSESTWSVGQWLPKSPSRLIPGSVVSPTAFETIASETYQGRSVSVLPPSETFQATLPVDKPGYPHRVTIRLPSNSMADLQIEVGKQPKQAATSLVIEADATADHQGPWREHSFVHYPVEGDQIWVTNLDPDTQAAFDFISVQAGPLFLAPPQPGTPRTVSQQPDSSPPSDSQAAPGSLSVASLSAATGSLPSASSSRLAAVRLTNLRWPETLTEDVADRTRLESCAASTVELNRLWVAAQRIQDEVRASGCNALVIPANHGAQGWYESSHFEARFDQASPSTHHLETLLELLGSSELQVFVELNPNMLLTAMERMIRNQEASLIEVTRSESTAVAAVFDSFSPDPSVGRAQYNPLHLQVQSEVSELARELCERCRRHAVFAGLLVDADRSSHLRPLRNSNEDPGAVLLFGRSNGVNGNFAQVRNWLQQQEATAFRDWVKQQLQSGYERVSRVDGSVAVRLVAPDTVVLEQSATSAAAQPGNPPTSATGPGNPATRPIDSPIDGLVSQFRYGPPAVLAQKSRLHQQITAATGAASAILVSEQRLTGSPSWVRQRIQHDLSQIIDHTDPKLLFVDHSLLANQLSDELQLVLQSFCAMPDCPMQRSTPVDSASHTVHLRSGICDGHLYVSMVNVVPWNCDVDLEMATPTQWEVLARGDTQQSEETGSESLVRTSGGTRTRVTIPAGQIVLLRSRAPGMNSVRSWTTRVSGGPELVESIKEKVTLIVERVGILSDFRAYSKLNNGGFEQSGGMGLVGWLHAQHPPGCVQIDDKQFVEGSHSVQLTTSTPAVARTWLVSETVEPPASGRLAVSLACRGEAKDDDSIHHVRISIEATRRGDPVRFTSELQVPRNGQWSEREVVLEIDEIETSEIESLRLTIDSLSGGRVWIDDVQLHDHFPTSRERAELQSQVFLAVQGLQRGNLLPTGKLLQNHWARHLLTLGPSEQPKRVIENVPASPEPPGVAERFRSWLPRPLRF